MQQKVELNVSFILDRESDGEVVPFDEISLGNVANETRIAVESLLNGELGIQLGACFPDKVFSGTPSFVVEVGEEASWDEENGVFRLLIASDDFSGEEMEEACSRVLLNDEDTSFVDELVESVTRATGYCVQGLYADFKRAEPVTDYRVTKPA